MVINLTNVDKANNDLSSYLTEHEHRPQHMI
jgi:hypothetical protein